jgi:hypothetical protein
MALLHESRHRDSSAATVIFVRHLYVADLSECC